jgi:hypothetical protein
VADRLDVVAVEVADKAAVVVGVVLGEDTGFVEDLGPDGHRGAMERVDDAPLRRLERDVCSSRSSGRSAGEIQNANRVPSAKPTAAPTSTGRIPSGPSTTS